MTPRVGYKMACVWPVVIPLRVLEGSVRMALRIWCKNLSGYLISPERQFPPWGVPRAGCRPPLSVCPRQHHGALSGTTRHLKAQLGGTTCAKSLIHIVIGRIGKPAVLCIGHVACMRMHERQQRTTVCKHSALCPFKKLPVFSPYIRSVL